MNHHSPSPSEHRNCAPASPHLAEVVRAVGVIVLSEVCVLVTSPAGARPPTR